MRELKLKYFIELVSNLGTKAKADADMVAASQQAMQRSIDKTGASMRTLDTAYARFASNSATERQIKYMNQLGTGIDNVASKMRSLAALTAKGLQAAPAAAAGLAGGFFAAKTLLDKPMDYGVTLARMANTAYDKQDTAGRTAGMKKLNDEIMKSVRGGIVPRAQAAEGLSSVLASGEVKDQADAFKLLGVLTKGSSATGATVDQLAAIAIRGKQNMGIPLGDAASLLDEANAAGKAGGFELGNMAKSLPQAMAGGTQSGLIGREGFRKIVAMMQASVITAGTKDEAANNVFNLLGKLNSEDTKKDFGRQGIDLRKEIVKGRANGFDSVDTFVSLVDKIAAKDKDYTKLKGKLASDKTDGDKRETMSSMANILQGKAIGTVVQDRQALMSLVAIMNNRGHMKEIQETMRGAKGSIDGDYALIENQTGTKATAVANEYDNAQYSAFSEKSGVLNTLLDRATALAQEFPKTATAATAAATALTVAGAAATLFAMLASRSARSLPGAGGAGGLPGGLPKTAGSPGPFPSLPGAATAAAGSALGVASVAGSVLAGGAVLALGATNMLANNKGMREAMLNDIGGDGAFAAAILSANDPVERPVNYRGKGFNDPRLLTLTSPGSADQPLAPGQATKVEVGEGKITIDLRVPDGYSALTTVTQQPSIMRISGGNTNPGGFK